MVRLTLFFSANLCNFINCNCADDIKLGERLIHQKAVLPSRRTWSGWRNGLTGTMRNSTKGSVESVTGKEKAHAPVYAKGYPARKQLGRKFLVDAQVEYESQRCSCGKEG